MLTHFSYSPNICFDQMTSINTEVTSPWFVCPLKSEVQAWLDFDDVVAKAQTSGKPGFPGSQKLVIISDFPPLSWWGGGCQGDPCCMFGNSSRPDYSLIRAEKTTKRLWQEGKKGPRPVREMPEMQNIGRRAHGERQLHKYNYKYTNSNTLDIQIHKYN